LPTKRYIRLEKETTPGTAATGGGKYIAISGETLESRPVFQAVAPQSTPVPTSAHGYGIPVFGDVSLVAPFGTQISSLLRMLFDDYTFTVDNPVAGINRHRFRIGSTRPSTAGQCHTVDVAMDFNFFRYAGVWSEGLTLSQRIGMELQATFGTIGSVLPTITAAPADQSPTTKQGWGFGPNFSDAQKAFDVEVPTATSRQSLITGLELRIVKPWNRSLFTGQSEFTSRDQQPGQVAITGTLFTDRDSKVIIDDLLAKTERTMKVIWKTGIVTGTERERMELTLQNVVFTGGPPHMSPGRTPSGYEASYSFEWYENTSPGVNIDVFSAEATL